MGQVIHLGASAEHSGAASPEARRRGFLVGVLVTVIVLALGTIVYVNWPGTPSNLVAGPATPDVSDGSAVFDPHATAEQRRVRQAEQEKEDSAVFGQAPSAAAYGTSGR